MSTKSGSQVVAYRRVGVIGSTAVTQTIPVVFNWSRTGSSVFQFRERIRSHQDATSDYTMNASRLLSKSPIAANCRGEDLARNVLQSSFTGDYSVVGTPSHNTTNGTAVHNGALMEAYKQLSSRTAQTNGLTILGEMSETVRQLRHPFSAVVSAAHAHLNRWDKRYRRAVREGKQSFADVASSSWLEFSLGIKPLMSDVEDLAKSFARFERPIINSDRFIGKSETEAMSGSTTFEVLTDSHIVARQVSSKRTTYGVRYFVCTDFSSQMLSDSQRLVQILGVTPENIVPALYEVLPWSWLLDYFTNVGDLIDASCQSSKRVRYVVRTVKQQTILTVSNTPDTVATFARLEAFGYPVRRSMTGTTGTTVVETTTLSRNRVYTLPIPTFELKSPFGTPGKVANMISVLWQRKPSSPF